MTCFMGESDYFQVPDLKTLLGIALYAVVLPYINLEPPGSLPSPITLSPGAGFPNRCSLSQHCSTSGAWHSHRDGGGRR